MDWFSICVTAIGCIGMIIALGCMMAPMLKNVPACRRWTYMEMSSQDCDVVLAEFSCYGVHRVGNVLQVPVAIEDSVCAYIEDLGIFVKIM